MVVKVVSVRCRGSEILNYCVPDGHLHMLPQRASAMHVLIVCTRFITVVLPTACVFVLETEIRGVRLQEEASAVVWGVAKRKKLVYTAWNRCLTPAIALSVRVAKWLRWSCSRPGFVVQYR